MKSVQDVVDILAGLALFADLSRPQLQAVAHTFEEELFDTGQRILRRGFSGSGFYVILEGEAAVQVEGNTIGQMSRGDFFGEISVLLEEAPSADVVATRPLHCLVLPGPALQEFLVQNPAVAVRMLRTQARRLRNNTQWLS
jgi:CRP/FNR family cyclic AMP-dependent transcriptional regulator